MNKHIQRIDENHMSEILNHVPLNSKQLTTLRTKHTRE